MGSLFRKELRSQAPFLALVFAIISLGLIHQILTTPPDQRPLEAVFKGSVEGATWYQLAILILILAFSSGILVREHHERTIEFLDALPVSRSRIFAAKFLTAYSILALIPVLGCAEAFVFQLLSRDSLNSSLHLPILLPTMFLALVEVFVLLSLGLFVSFFRRLAWVLVGILVWTHFLLADLAPSLSIFDPFAVGEPSFIGQRLALPASRIVAQLGLGSGLVLAAYLLHLGLGDRMLEIHQRFARRRMGAIFLGGCVILALSAWVSVFLWTANRDRNDEREGPAVDYIPWGNARCATRSFTFNYPANLEGRARPLIAEADRAREAVLGFLGGTSDSPIHADLRGELVRHAGQAFWKTIRMDLRANDDPGVLVSILGHEVAHVECDLISRSRLWDHFHSTRFFHEGLATYLEYRLFRGLEAVEPLRRVAGVHRARKEADFEDLVDDARFREKRDPDLVYPLGEAFVAALVERYGDEAPGRLLRAFAQEGMPRDLSGIDLWREAFQRAGLSLEAALGSFYLHLDRAVERHRDFIRGLRRITGVITIEDEWIWVQTRDEPPDGWSVACRFRRDPGDEPHRFIEAPDSGDGDFAAARNALSGESFWYQLGSRDPSAGLVIYEPWVKVLQHAP